MSDVYVRNRADITNSMQGVQEPVKRMFEPRESINKSPFET